MAQETHMNLTQIYAKIECLKTTRAHYKKLTASVNYEIRKLQERAKLAQLQRI